MKQLVIIDIVSNNFNEIDQKELDFDNNDVLALSPCSFYYLSNRKIKYSKFHDLISTENFRNKVLSIYADILSENNNEYFKGYAREITQYISQLLFVNVILNYISLNKYRNLIYITDKNIVNKLMNLSNVNSILSPFINFTKVIKINKNNDIKKITFFDKLKKYSFSRLINKIINRIENNNLHYDWGIIKPTVTNKELNIFERKIIFDLTHDDLSLIEFKTIKFSINKGKIKSNIFLTFLESSTYVKIKDFLTLEKRIFFFQHGSYLYKNIFIKYSEIEPADVNFVFNDYTKDFFEREGGKKIYSVGSILFNPPFKIRKQKYDFLYITQGHDYLGTLQYIDFANSLHSIDGHELYLRHKNIIELFGENFNDKQILIRVHPCIITSGLYVPFWEMSKKYSNITIDISSSMNRLIEESNYIISDYFTSEFINREIHYKKDIILFNAAPTPLPSEILEDMNKMFILVNNMIDLTKTIENIESIKYKRIRNDSIIEYYSSKKCDTKKIVGEIIRRELNERG